MKILKYIANNLFRRRDSLLTKFFGNSFSGFALSQLSFAKVIFTNIVEILTDLSNDVTFTRLRGNASLFGEFKAFYEYYAQYVFNKLYVDGFVVITHDEVGFRLMNENEYRLQSLPNGNTKIVPIDDSKEVYVMKSETFEMEHKSDREFLSSFLVFLDNILNASNTISERLGALVVASPKNLNNAPTATILTKEQKDELEKELQKEYGSLSNQKSIMMLPREMNFETISLSALDLQTEKKARLAILAICDRIKVPANQVAIIDANSNKSLSNGSELREGDAAKYKSFERLLNRTFVRFANEIGLKVDYTIYNKPTNI